MINNPTLAQNHFVLLGPQTDFAEVRSALDALGVEGRVALVTAGWQENEAEDEALAAALGRPTVNLALHARSEQVFAQDPEFAAASEARQKHLQHLQEFYRIRLDSVDDAGRAVAVRHVSPELLAEQVDATIAELRFLDEEHIRRCRGVWTAFDAVWQADCRDVIRYHREEVAALLADCGALVIAGGHVMSLLNRLRLLAPLATFNTRPVVAWSAGAMCLTDRVVLFHDFPPFGGNLAQMLDHGLGVCPGIVAMPDLARRVRTDDAAGIGRFARRMAPSLCLGLDPGSRIEVRHGRTMFVRAVRLTPSGTLDVGYTP